MSRPQQLIVPPEAQEIIVTATKKTRETIVKLYIKCEEDFRKGLEIFDDIIQEKEMEKIDRQRTILKEELENITNN